MSLAKTKVRNEKELQLRKALIKTELLADEMDMKQKIPFSNFSRPVWLTNEVIGVFGTFLFKLVIKKVLRKK